MEEEMNFDYRQELRLGKFPSPRKCIRGAEYIVPSDDATDISQRALVILSIRATDKTYRTRSSEAIMLFCYMLTLAGIPHRKMPTAILHDEDNHTVGFELMNWDDDEYINFGTVLEMIADISEWKLGLNFKINEEFQPTFRGALSC